ncbi:hypothetical protein JCM11641_005909 [Rhodosporidiobolus odoratus]
MNQEDELDFGEDDLVPSSSTLIQPNNPQHALDHDPTALSTATTSSAPTPASHPPRSTPQAAHDESLDVLGNPLPKGWVSRVSKSTGDVYYRDTLRNTSSWEIPTHSAGTDPVEAPAPSPAAAPAPVQAVAQPQQAVSKERKPVEQPVKVKPAAAPATAPTGPSSSSSSRPPTGPASSRGTTETAPAPPSQPKLFVHPDRARLAGNAGSAANSPTSPATPAGPPTGPASRSAAPPSGPRSAGTNGASNQAMYPPRRGSAVAPAKQAQNGHALTAVKTAGNDAQPEWSYHTSLGALRIVAARPAAYPSPLPPPFRTSPAPSLLLALFPSGSATSPTVPTGPSANTSSASAAAPPSGPRASMQSRQPLPSQSAAIPAGPRNPVAPRSAPLPRGGRRSLPFAPGATGAATSAPTAPSTPAAPASALPRSAPRSASSANLVPVGPRAARKQEEEDQQKKKDKDSEEDNKKDRGPRFAATAGASWVGRGAPTPAASSGPRFAPTGSNADSAAPSPKVDDRWAAPASSRRGTPRDRESRRAEEEDSRGRGGKRSIPSTQDLDASLEDYQKDRPPSPADSRASASPDRGREREQDRRRDRNDSVASAESGGMTQSKKLEQQRLARIAAAQGEVVPGARRADRDLPPHLAASSSRRRSSPPPSSASRGARFAPPPTKAPSRAAPKGANALPVGAVQNSGWGARSQQNKDKLEREAREAKEKEERERKEREDRQRRRKEEEEEDRRRREERRKRDEDEREERRKRDEEERVIREEIRKQEEELQDRERRAAAYSNRPPRRERARSYSPPLPQDHARRRRRSRSPPPRRALSPLPLDTRSRSPPRGIRMPPSFRSRSLSRSRSPPPGQPIMRLGAGVLDFDDRRVDTRPPPGGGTRGRYRDPEVDDGRKADEAPLIRSAGPPIHMGGGGGGGRRRSLSPPPPASGRRGEKRPRGGRNGREPEREGEERRERSPPRRERSPPPPKTRAAPTPASTGGSLLSRISAPASLPQRPSANGNGSTSDVTPAKRGRDPHEVIRKEEEKRRKEGR